jgi:hypothetical protein
MCQKNAKVFYTKHFLVNIYIDNRSFFFEDKTAQLIIILLLSTVYLYRSFFVVHDFAKERRTAYEDYKLHYTSRRGVRRGVKKKKRENNVIGIN